eukprot:gnl/TRDRNA2_/TRDRNA2_188772_c0_seq1.p1 gnl/TRDRNA2_/TRDRNA2_188772_c0~~gnl/TRDRNA2_/TRDRNA2_188772_c0_seq1.p1  ORF type:complete len:112 (-),score=27.03 gnl/TRDRNA2_/TRDRNA2_188772_c0_seq1:66-401(-)
MAAATQPSGAAEIAEGHAADAGTETSAAKAFVKKLMDTVVRISISDGRLITGQLWCIDNLKNVILLHCQETRKTSAGEEHRPLGPLVMVPGKHITKIEAQQPYVEIAKKAS